MLIGKRLKSLREAKALTQGNIEQAVGLTRPYISRVENGRSVPGIEILEKWANALGMPLYELMHDGEKPLPPPRHWPVKEEKLWGDSEEEAADLKELRECLSRMTERQRGILLSFVSRLATRSRSRSK